MLTLPFAVFELLFVRSIQTFEDPIPPADFGYIVLFVGASPWLICETVVWSLTSTYLVDLASKGSNIDSRAYACNVVGILSPLVVLVFTLVYSILGGKAYSEAVKTFDKLDSILLGLGAIWTREDDITSSPAPPPLLLTAFELQLERIESTWRANFLLQAISGTLLLLVLAAVAIPYLYGLHKSLKQMDTVLCSSTNGEGSRHSRKLRSAWLVSFLFSAARRLPLIAVVLTFNPFLAHQSLLITLSVFAVCCTVQVALNYVVYAYPFNLQDPKWSQAILFVPFFATGILGLPCGWLLFWTALKAQSERKNQGWSLWYTEVGTSTRPAGVARLGNEIVEGSRDVEGDGAQGGDTAFAREEWIAVLGRNDSRAGQSMRGNENEGKELEKEQAGFIGV